MNNSILKDPNGNLWHYLQKDGEFHVVTVVDYDNGHYTDTCITCYLTDEELANCTKIKMKHQIVRTKFLEDICENLELAFFNAGCKSFYVTPTLLFNNLDFANMMVQVYNEHLFGMLEVVNDPYDYREIKSEIEDNSKLFTDLAILGDLEVPYYANPRFIGNAITILSEKLSEQLEARVNEEAHYDDYYCKRLAEVLAELCTLIKEV